MALGWIGDIEKLTVKNSTFRTVLYTAKHSQLTVMTIPVGEEIGNEVHAENDQFIRIEQGSAKITMGPDEASEDWAVIIPAGTWHNVINAGDDELKLYSVYSPAEHPDGTVHETKADAEAAEKAEG